MNALDWLVLFAVIVGIAAYGMWQTRGSHSPGAYFKGGATVGWGTIGLSVMATQASAITFLSIPGQAYDSGLGFVQNYFGLPLALVVVSAVFLPIYRRLGVYTAYEYLGRRFDARTRVLGALLFLLQRGLSAGVTIYAPAIILSTVLGWRLDLTVLATGLLVIAYTVTGGSAAVGITQKWQMGVIFAGMVTAFVVLLARLPQGVGFLDATHVAGAMGKLETVDLSLNPDRRYTLWSGLLGGFFLSLAYFGTDQSQVQRYIGGSSLREGRLGLMFNGLLKIPMQFFILLLGTLVFVFHQFDRPPVFFNEAAWTRHAEGGDSPVFQDIEERHAAAHATTRERITAWLAVRENGDAAAEASAREAMVTSQAEVDSLREEAKSALAKADPRIKTKDSDYIFITFILRHLPHGAIGLLVAVMIAASLSSTASELNSLATTTTIDLWRRLRPEGTGNDARNVRVAKWMTLGWGAFAIGFALFANVAENLIEAINILGSVFYGVVLGIFLVAFFLKHIGGRAVFWGAVAAQSLVFLLFFTLPIGYLWFNLIGCAACVAASLGLQALSRAGREVVS